MPEDKIDVAEAARMLGVTLNYLYSLLWAGRLKGQKIKGQWRISMDAIEARRKEKGE
jgi:excisionase family DNA binding protein